MTPEQWLQVKEIFHDAAELPAAERAAFLTERCADDAGMLRELQLLLESHDEAENFIECPAAASAAEILSGGGSGLWTGRTVGHYRVMSEIGRGGMGLVLLALRADDQFKKRVAIKILRRGMDTEDLLRRFRNERQILASLEHPNIARLMDGGVTEDGLPYFVLEYIEGEPLDKYCDEHKLSINERLELFRKVCAVVQYAHQNLVIHRDLKPSNILVTAEGEPKLLDFGIAKLLNPELAAQTLLATATFMRLMTPEYASPEQIRGDKITTMSDVYSLGVLLYRLLTSRAPYRFTNTTSPHEIERLICETEPGKPSTAISRVEEIPSEEGTTRITPEIIAEARREQPEALRRQLRGDLDNIVLMALRKEPERRYSSPARLSEDLRRYMQGLPVMARKDTFAYRASKFVGRNKAGVAAALLVLVAILAGLTASVWQARVAARERDVARQERVRADQLNTFLKSILSAASPEQKGKDARVIEVLNDAAARIDAEFVGQPELKAQALMTIGETYFDVGLMDESEKALREALKINSELHGPGSRATALSMTRLGMTLLNKAEYDEAEKLLSAGVEAERKFSPRGSPELALSLFVLGELYVRRGASIKDGLEKAKQLLEESINISDRLSGENNENSAYTMVSLARAKQFSGDTGGAEATYRKSIAIFRRLPRNYEFRMATALLGLGNLLTAKGDYDEGVRMVVEADQIYLKLGESWQLFISKYYLCSAYYNKGDYGQAIEAGEKAIDTGRKIGLENTPDYISTLALLGSSLSRAGRAKEAEPILREALDRAVKALQKGNVNIHLIEGALGECLTEQKRYVEAEPLLIASYDGLKNFTGADKPATKLAERRLFTLYDNWGKADKAAEYKSN